MRLRRYHKLVIIRADCPFRLHSLPLKSACMLKSKARHLAKRRMRGRLNILHYKIDTSNKIKHQINVVSSVGKVEIQIEI